MLKELLPPGKHCFWFDLLEDDLYQRLVARPQIFEEIIPAEFDSSCWVVADEIQRAPGLLNYVHRLIENRGIKFALSGSSARKLRRSGANLLAGRAFNNSLFPLTCFELGSDFNLREVLNFGSLPFVFSLTDSTQKKEYLKSYVGNYLRQEIKEEQIVRKLEPFIRFLEAAAQSNGKIINASEIGRASSTDGKSVLRYYEILEDTLLGFFLEPYHRSIRKVQTDKSKFYLFDLGIKRALEQDLSSEITESSFAFGNAFEHFFIAECHRARHYLRIDERAYYLRTKDDAEIDLIIERPKGEIFAIEIKSAERVDETKLRTSINLAMDLKPRAIWIASREKHPRNLGDKVEILPWREVLHRLYGLSLYGLS